MSANQCELSEISLLDASLNDSSISNFHISEDEISPGHTNARDELIDELMKLSLRHNWTKVAVEDVAKLLNNVPGATIFPATKYVLAL